MTLASLVDISDPKSLDFQGPPLPMPRVVDLPTLNSLRQGPYKPGTVTIILSLSDVGEMPWLLELVVVVQNSCLCKRKKMQEHIENKKIYS